MENMENEIIFIKLDDIIPNRFQPREVFDEVALNELADSIRQHGVIQPIVVRQVGNKYEIIAGERRYKASAIAGLTKIPAIIKNLDDKESSIVAYIENAQRRNVSVIEEARTSERILKNNNMTQEQLAHELGISQSALANKLRLLSLPLEVQDALMKNEISERHARSLLSVKEPNKQIELLNRVKNNKMTVRELESEIKSMYDNNTTNVNNDGSMYVNNNMNAQFIPTNMNDLSVNNNQFVGNSDTYNQFINNDFNNMSNNYSNNQPVNNLESDTYLNNTVQNNPVQNNNFNNYDNQSNDLNQPSFEDDSFLNFENNFDPSKYEKSYIDNNAPQYNETINTQINDNNGSFLDFLNNNNQNTEVNNFNNNVNGLNDVNNMNLLNNTNNMSFLNNDSDNDGNNDNGGNYVNNYDNTQPIINNEVYDNNYQPTPSFNNPVINNVNPPVTSNFNMNEVKYVEDDNRYKDITKPEMFSSVDEIINELKLVVDGIKNNSKVKIDTDEINFDDIYQITIKIDKGDIL